MLLNIGGMYLTITKQINHDLSHIIGYSDIEHGSKTEKPDSLFF